LGHPSIESLRRELLRNPELRAACGFSALKGELGVPPPAVWTRFLQRLQRHRELIEQMFAQLVERLGGLLPQLGERLAVDSKAIHSHARGKHDPAQSSDPEANWGRKTYAGVRPDGTPWKKVKSWFGYKLHLVVDSTYELPLGYMVTPASAADSPQLLPLVEQLAEQQPWLVERTQYLSADKGYDSKENNQELWDRYGIKPVIDIRATWQEERELPRSLYPQRVDTIFHTEGGEVLCRYQDTAVEADNYARMTFQGFEADRECLKYRCPAQAQGLTCTQRHLCYGAGEVGAYGRIVRIPLETERRTFTPVARASYAWEREYRHRTAVERVNSRLDTSFGYEQHFIRGLGKMRLRMDLTMLVMLAMAVGRIQAEQPEQLRSLVRPPARGQPRRAA